MKENKLLLMGMLPFFVGYIFYIVSLQTNILSSSVSAIYLMLWSLLTYLLSEKKGSVLAQTCKALSIPTVILLALLYQEILLGAYWDDFIGIWSQLYYTPALSLAMSADRILLDSQRLWPTYCLEWLMLAFATHVGVLCKKRFH